MRQPDGSVALLDLGSMNGTRRNGVAVEPNILVTLAPTDQITLGCWTRLALRMR
jgi:pSer/pThr/pTyr-binding forkhead associated (FHA) protein